MKKSFALLCIAGLLCALFTLAACSEGGSPTRSDTPTGTSEVVKPTEPTQPTETNKPEETETPTPTKPSNAVWKEVPIKDEPLWVGASRSPFDLKATVMGTTQDGYTFNTFVFSGTVINRKEYRISWTSDEGELWGSYPYSVIEVRINKKYHGKSPVAGNVIRVLYSYSLSEIFYDSVYIKEGGEYVFASNWVLDERYTNNIAKLSPDSVNNGFTEYADIMVGSAWCSLLPIENGKVVSYFGYFNHDETVESKTLSPDSVKTTLLTNPDSLKNGDFIAMNLKDFEEEFLKLFENPDKLPTATHNLYE